MGNNIKHMKDDTKLGYCDSCYNANDPQKVELFDVPHHQAGNDTVWHYCAQCKAVHEREVKVINDLKELSQNYPVAVNDPKIAAMLHEGKSVKEVSHFIDSSVQPDLEAEVTE